MAVPTASTSSFWIEAPVLWSTASEIKHKTFADSFTSHLSFCKPLHHHEGKISIQGNLLVLEGVNKRDRSATTTITLSPNQVRDIHHGFDECFRRSYDRGLGLTSRPLRLTVKAQVTKPSVPSSNAQDQVSSSDKGEPTVLYMVVNHGRIAGSSKNSEWFDLLKAWADRQR